MATLEEIRQYAYYRRTLSYITQSMLFFSQVLRKYKFEQYFLSYFTELINELDF